MIKRLFNTILRPYEKSEYLFRAKITVVFSATLCLVLIAATYIIYYGMGNRAYDPGIMIPAVVCAIMGIASLVSILRGYFYLSAHLIFVGFFAAIWVAIFTEKGPVLQRMDTFILTIALLSVTPFLVARMASFIIIWYCVDMALLYIFTLTVGPTLGLTRPEILEYLLDTSVALGFTAILSYLNFSFSSRAIQRSRESERKVAEKNRELLTVNEELFESMQHLGHMNEKYASQNRALAAAQEEIVRREETMSSLVRSLPLGVAVVHDRKFRWVNKNLCDMIGYTQEELLDIDSTTLYPDMDEYRHIGGKTADLIEKGGVVETQTTWIRKNGETIYVSLRGSWINRDHPEDGFIVTIIDITEKLNTLDALHESRSTYRLLAENITDVIWALDTNLQLYYISPSVTTLYGFTPEEVRGRTLRDWVPPDRYRYLADRLRGIFSENSPAQSDPNWSIREVLPQTGKDGRSFWVEIIMSLIRDIDGRPMGAVGVTRDITPRIEAEAMAERERTRLTVTLGSITEGVIATGLNGRVMLMNRTAEEMTGHTFAEAEGKPVDLVYDPVDPMTGQPVSSVTRVLSDGQVSDTGEKMILYTSGGGVIRITESCSPLKTADGMIIGAVTVFRDVTEREIWERERLKMQQLQSLGVLAGGIAHDFNNILSGILGNISLARMDGISEEERMDNISEAEKAAEQARRLTSQLLTFARGGSPVRENSSISEIVNESVSFALRGSGVRGSFMIQDGLWPGNVDRGQIGQVIHNLTLNAMQAMDGSGTITIQMENQVVTARDNLPLQPGPYLRISITDTGKGISPENIDRIFEPYFTTRSEGHGLGLSVVYSIISRHGGHISVESRPGHGTSFILWLPAAPKEDMPSSVSRGGISTTRQTRILLMDDDISVRSVAARMLRSIGCEVIMATSGEEAIKSFRDELDGARSVDLAILDITVPGGMGGRETLEQLRFLNPSVRAIASSGYSNDSLMAEYRSWGFNGVLAKPYNREELSAAIDAALK